MVAMGGETPSQLEKEVERLREENNRLRQLVQMLAGLVDSRSFELMKAARESLEILDRIGGEDR